MPAKRKYNVKGTNDFLVLAGIFFFLCLWAVKDAWFPSPKVVKKHPMEISVAFATAGSVEKVHVAKGEHISENQVLANLRRDRLQVEYDEAKDAYATAKNQYTLLNTAAKNAFTNGASDAGIEDLRARAEVAKLAMDEALSVVVKLRADMDASELRAPSKGIVKEILVATHTLVEKEQTAMVIDPKDHFYLFNKSLAVFSFFAFWVFLAIHVLAR